MGQVVRTAAHRQPKYPRFSSAPAARRAQTTASPSLRRWKTSCMRLTPMARAKTRTVSRSPYWSVHLGNPLPVNRIPRDIGAFLGHFNIPPATIESTSTPVIDPERQRSFSWPKIGMSTPGKMYCDGEVATKNCPVVNRIVALNLATGAVARFQGRLACFRRKKSQTGDSAGLHPCGPLDNRKPTVRRLPAASTCSAQRSCSLGRPISGNTILPRLRLSPGRAVSYVPRHGSPL